VRRRPLLEFLLVQFGNLARRPHASGYRAVNYSV
jgi:hypothetical protein